MKKIGMFALLIALFVVATVSCVNSEKINTVSNLSNDDMVKFVTEWAKRNGSLPK